MTKEGDSMAKSREIKHFLPDVEEQYRLIIQTSNEGVFITDADGSIVFSNQKLADMIGCTLESVAGKKYFDLFHGRNGESIRAKVERNVPITERFEVTFSCDDGTERWAIFSSTPIVDITKKYIGLLAMVMDITERKKIEDVQSRLTSIVDSSDDAIIGITQKGDILSWNAGAARLYGYDGREVTGRSISLLAPAGHEDEFLRILNRIRQGEHFKHYETIRKKKNGTLIDVSLTISPIIDMHGRIVGASVIARDMTESKSAEESIRQANAYNRSLIEASLDPLVTIDPRGHVTDVNKATEFVTGYPREKLIGTDFSIYFTDPIKAKKGYLTVFKKGAVTDYPLEIRHLDGHLTPVLYNASVYKDETGRVIGVFAAARDITKRKQAEEAVRVASAYNRSLIEAGLDPLVTIAQNGRITDVNKATEHVTGISREQLIGTDFSNYFTEPEKAREGYLTAFKKGAVTDYPLEIRHRDGGTTPVLYNASVYRNEAGKVIGVFAAARDITERKRAEEVISTAYAYNRSLIEASLDPLVTIAPDGKITDVNKATEKVTGYPREMLIGTDFSYYFTDPTKAKEGYQKVFETGSVKDYPLEIRNRDGSMTSVLYNASVYREESGKVIGVFAAARDVTELYRAEAALKEKIIEVEQSNTELQQFAYIASHDLQEPLRVVASYVKLLDRRYKDKLDADANDFINYAIEGSTRMQQMIDDLLTYSRVGTKGKPFQPTDLETIFDRVLGNLRVSIAESHATVIHDPLPTVLADDLQMMQLFQNLIGNSIKFRSSERAPTIHVSAKKRKDIWEFSVADNGIGIAPEFYDRIFIIFNRLHTRDEYPGSGIGLAICKKIVERHGGRIWVESKLGEGTMFRFTIPFKVG
jgi:PAS domain S-box-containing protein